MALFPRAKVRGLRSGLAVKRSYPMPEVRGSSREELPHVRGQGQRPRVPGCNSTEAAKMSYPTSKVKDDSWKELPTARGQGQEPR